MTNEQLYAKLSSNNRHIVYNAINKQLQERGSPTFKTIELFEQDKYINKWLEENKTFSKLLSMHYTLCCKEIKKYKNKALVAYAENYVEYIFRAQYIKHTDLTPVQKNLVHNRIQRIFEETEVNHEAV